MHWYGGGFIPIIIYAIGGNVVSEDNAILTENSLELLTEASQELLVESA